MSEIHVTDRNLDNLIISEDGALILDGGEYSLSKTLYIDNAVTIEGNGSLIRAADENCSIIVRHSDVVAKDFRMAGFVISFEIDAHGGIVENVTVDHVDIDMDLIGFQIGSSLSGSVLRNITLKNSTVSLEGFAQWEEDELAARVPVEIGAAVSRIDSGPSVDDCLIDGLTIENVRTQGETRLGMNIMNGVGSAFSLEFRDRTYNNNVLKNVLFKNCTIDTCWDSPFNISCGFMNNTNSRIENIEFVGNDVKFGISGLYMFSGEPLFGDACDTVIRNVRIHGNTFTRGVADVGEPSRGLFIAATRSDYYHNMNLKNNVVENVEITDNTFDGAGPVIAGCYAMLDGLNTIHENNVVRGVTISGNRILNADYAFTIEGVQLEGRLHDWNFGYPRHDKKWSDLMEDDSVVTTTFINDRIENICVKDNKVNGYRYRVLASGADLRGHGEATGCCVTEGVVFENNTFTCGENHVRIADFIGEDWVHDRGGNKVSRAFYNAKLV